MNKFDQKNMSGAQKAFASIQLCAAFFLFGHTSALAKVKPTSQEKMFGAMDIGTHFSNLKSPLLPINEHAKIPDFAGCKRLGIQSIRPQDECEFLSFDNIIYFLDVRGLIYKIKLIPNSKNKWPHKFPYGIKPTDNKQKIQAKFAKFRLESNTNNNDKSKDFPNQVACYHTKYIYSKTVCFLFDAKGKIAQVRIDSWDFGTFDKDKSPQE